MYVAVFLLAFAGDPVGSFGTVTDPNPVPQEICVAAISSPTVLERVKSFIKEQTGEDVEVTGLCHGVDDEEDE